MTQDEIISLLPSIKVHPFPPIISLNHDGLIVPFGSTTTYKRIARLQCPTCLGIDDFYNCSGGLHYQSKYCKGGHPPYIECNHGDEKVSHPVACAGIDHPHLHVFCNCCQNSFFLAIPGGY